MTINYREFFRIWSQAAHHPALIDLVQSEDTKWVVMFSMQKSVDIVGA
jgi:hypothetical protein